jgi:membrane protein implicated in regulation of membrane protease activity
LLERHSNVFAFLALMISMSSGIGGAALIFWCLWKLNAKEQPLDPADYDMIGVLGKVASPIRQGGTGELLYSRAGSRRAAAARSEDGTEIPRDTEVVVTRFEKGIAYVRRWDDLNGERL